MKRKEDVYMSMDTVLLEDLKNDEMVSFEDANYTLTVSQLKEELMEDSETAKKTWYVAVPETWTPDARSMLETYLENEYQEMYEDWDERAADCVTDDVVQKLQAIMDDAFKSPNVKNYWSLGKRIVI